MNTSKIFINTSLSAFRWIDARHPIIIVSSRLSESCFLLGDDSLHFKSGQSEADDEHAEGKIEKHSVRGISRF